MLWFPALIAMIALATGAIVLGHMTGFIWLTAFLGFLFVFVKIGAKALFPIDLNWPENLAFKFAMALLAFPAGLALSHFLDVQASYAMALIVGVLIASAIETITMIKLHGAEVVERAN